MGKFYFFYFYKIHVSCQATLGVLQSFLQNVHFLCRLTLGDPWSACCLRREIGLFFFSSWLKMKVKVKEKEFFCVVA